MSKNTGIPYEVLTQQIFQAIHDQSQIKNVKVQHNVELQGTHLKHQIDVYWEYELGGIVYRAIVQAKDWGQAVTQNQLLSFKAILDDLPGQPRGIFVTRTGYQIGARTYAEANGIKLYELRQPTDEDTKGRIKTICLNMVAFPKNYSGVEPIQDQAWVDSEFARRGLTAKDHITMSFGEMADKIFLLDENDKVIGNFQDAIMSLFPDDGYSKLAAGNKEHIFPTPTFIATGNASFPRMKLRGIRATISIERVEQKIIWQSEDFISFIMRDVIGGNITLIDKDKRPVKTVAK
jgi:hypothetical protein